MATGRLGAVELGALTYTNLYKVPTDTFAVASISLANRTTSPVQVRVAVTTTDGPSAPSNGEFIEYGTTIAANGVLERTGLVLAANQIVSIYAATTGISAVAMGIETSTV